MHVLGLRLRTDQRYGGRYQGSVVPGGRAVGQHRHIFQPCTDPMPSRQGSAIDGPAGHAVSVVNLTQGDARRYHELLHPGCIPGGGLGIEVKRLDQDAATVLRQSGTHEGPGVIEREQASLDLDAAGEEEITKVQDAGLSLIRANQVGHLLPGLDNTPTLLGIRNDRGRGGERDRRVGTESADATQHLRTRTTVKGFLAPVVERVDMDRVSAGAHGRGGCLSDGGSCAWRGGVEPVAIERDLQEWR